MDIEQSKYLQHLKECHLGVCIANNQLKYLSYKCFKARMHNSPIK